jgi:2-C-methyl-D-erythritol 2,4-cyclodiphosphate synthase
MRKVIAELLAIEESAVSIKATTSEKMGFVGREEGVAAYASVLIESIGNAE